MASHKLAVSSTNPRLNRQRYLILLLLVGIAAFQVATIRPGHGWGDDFAMYIKQAKNFAAGVPLGETGYIYNPHYPQLGPRAYPPLYPLLLAPIYRFFGLNLTAMKVEGIACFLLALLIVRAIFASELLFQDLFVLIAVLGFNPFFWEAKDRIGSDLLFFALSALALYLMILVQKNGGYGIGLSVFLGVVIYLCYATRIVGCVLVVCLILYDIVGRQALTRASVVSSLIAVFFMSIHSFVFRSAQSSYADNIHVSWQAIAHNLKGYWWELHNSLWPFYGRLTSWLFTCLLLGLGIAGYAHRARWRLSVLEIFAPIYTSAILLWTSEYDTRFLIPVLPLWLYYVITSVQLIAAKYLNSRKSLASLILLVLFTLSFTSAYKRMHFGPIEEGVGDARFLQVCEYIRAGTAPNSVIVFAKPRLLVLMTDRRAAAYHTPPIDSGLWSFLTEISANYILVSGELTSDITYMQGFVDRRKGRLKLLFDNEAFALYRITST